MPSDTATASFSPEQTNPPTEELISLIEISRTQKPSLTIENYHSNNETIVFESNGYRDGDDFLPVKNDDEIASIHSNQ